jgi:hypothetical protein
MRQAITTYVAEVNMRRCPIRVPAGERAIFLDADDPAPTAVGAAPTRGVEVWRHEGLRVPGGPATCVFA